MGIITKEYLNDKDLLGVYFLKCDVPIWEEFAVGLKERGSWASGNNFRGVRGLLCQVPNTNKYKDIYIVTHNPKSQAFFDFIKDGFLDGHFKHYKNVTIDEHERLNKKVYIINYEFI